MSGINFVKAGSTVSLSKGEEIGIRLNLGDIVLAKVTWSAEKDYDALGLVEFNTGRKPEWAAQFGTYQTPDFTPIVRDSAGKVVVKHRGDVDASGGSSSGGFLGKFGRKVSENSGLAEEVMEIMMTEEILNVYFAAYSARKNGAGSFRRYGVSMELLAPDGTSVLLPSDSANANDGVYTCAPGVVRTTPGGIIVKKLELYSSGGENRPAIVNGTFLMDRGEENMYKN